MFESFSQLAERAATNLSRRQFLGRLGDGATALAVIVGGLLALCSEASAASRRTICGNSSSLYCLSKNAGDPCGAGKCVVIKGTVNTCVCRQSGFPGPR